MASLELVGGSLRVTYPDSYRVARRRPAAARPSVWAGPVTPTSEVSAALLDAFATQSLELAERFELVPATPATPPVPAGQRGAPAAAGVRQQRPNRAGKVRVELDLPEGQDAVVLLEQDGFYSWQLPTARDRTATKRATAAKATAAAKATKVKGPAATGVRGASAAEPGSRVVRFELDVRPAIPARQGARTRPALGPFGDFVIGGLKAYVLTFASPLIPGALMAFLERSTRPGLVLMTGTDVKSWSRVDDLSQVKLPEGRPARILLFVHGTFSTTVGSYGVLTVTAPGKQFLKAAAGSYDAIIGFDHRTLSRDPLENAVDLLARLETRQLASAPRIDVVSYSRGALVTRSLIEYLLPSSGWQGEIGTVVFVGGTNAGTLLAEPERWSNLADLYTNLAAGTARSVGFATGTAPVAEIVGGLVGGIGAFVKYLASVAAQDWHIPGLAAMEPDGPFIKGINATQPGQPAAGTPWYVVSSDFEPKLFDDRHEPPELPRELVAKLADGLVDNLMGTSNDLVVNTASMTAVDLPAGGGFIKDSLAFGTNGVVHHLNYFVQPQVCHCLARWLGVAEGAAPRQSTRHP